MSKNQQLQDGRELPISEEAYDVALCALSLWVAECVPRAREYCNGHWQGRAWAWSVSGLDRIVVHEDGWIEAGVGMGDTTAEPAEWIETGAHARFKEEAGQVSLEITFGDTQYGLTAPVKSPREQGSLERLWCDGRPLFTLRARNREANP